MNSFTAIPIKELLIYLERDVFFVKTYPRTCGHLCKRWLD